MRVVFILISEWIISVKPVQVGGQLPITVKITGFVNQWYYELVMEFMSKSLLSALQQDLKSEML